MLFVYFLLAAYLQLASAAAHNSYLTYYDDMYAVQVNSWANGLPVSSRFTEKIVNGSPVSQRRFLDHYSYIVRCGGCTGILINSRWVVAAAHCRDPSSGGRECCVGSADCSWGTERTIIRHSRVFRHPDYDSSTYDNDIMLIQLSQAAPRNLRFARLNGVDTTTSFLGRSGTMIGYGFTQVGQLNERLHEGSTRVQSSLCRRGVKICTSNSGTTTANGDSGGPLIVNGVVVGVLTGSSGSNHETSIYEPTASHQRWMANTMR